MVKESRRAFRYNAPVGKTKAYKRTGPPESATQAINAPRRHGLARAVVAGAVILALTLAAYLPAMGAGYIWDDDDFLTQNALIKAPDGLYRFWFTTEAYDYFPLTSTMLWFEWRIWGDRPAGYHVVNIILHGLAAVVLWRVLRRLGIPGAYFAAMVFALHPVCAASVAWITERKNTLPMVLYLLSALAWLRFDDGGKRRWYAFSLLLFLAAMLAKTSVVMLPAVLLLLAWWRRGRGAGSMRPCGRPSLRTPVPADARRGEGAKGRTVVLRTVPFFVLSLVLGLVTVWFQNHRAIAGVAVRPEGIASRLAASGWIVWFYLYKLLLPVNLIMIYPRWEVDGANPVHYLPLAFLLAALAFLWRFRRSWGRSPLLALGYFVITLLPVLGFIDMSFMRYSLVADHLQYTAAAGAIALAAGLPAAWARRFMPRAVAIPGAVAMLAVLGAMTWAQASTYQDEETLWTTRSRTTTAPGLRTPTGALFAMRGGIWTLPSETSTGPSS